MCACVLVCLFIFSSNFFFNKCVIIIFYIVFFNTMQCLFHSTPLLFSVRGSCYSALNSFSLFITSQRVSKYIAFFSFSLDSVNIMKSNPFVHLVSLLRRTSLKNIPLSVLVCQVIVQYSKSILIHFMIYLFLIFTLFISLFFIITFNSTTNLRTYFST